MKKDTCAQCDDCGSRFPWMPRKCKFCGCQTFKIYEKTVGNGRFNTGMKQLEAEILVEAKAVTGNQKLRQKDILEWSTGKITPDDGETVFYLPQLGVNIAVKVPASTTKQPKQPKA